MTIIKSYIVTNAAASQAGGGLTSFSVGNLSPLFTASLGADPLANPALTFSAVNQNANLVYAGPATGAAAAPTFRALVSDDMPIFDAGDLQINNGGGTFHYTIVASNITANRSAILPLLTVSDTFVMQAFAQTLTNKTIVAASNTITDTSAVAGDLLKHNGTRFVRFPMGTSLQIMRVNAGATDLEYVDTSSLTGFWSATGDTTLNPTVGTTINIFIDSTDTLRFLPTTGDQVGRIFMGEVGNTFDLISIHAQDFKVHARNDGFESITLNETNSNFFASDGTTNSSLRLTGTTATITGTLATFAGLQAAADYSANFTARSYIDKGYADATYEPAFTVLGPASGGTGIANNAASTLTISGNFATTLTVTAGTSVTLPTSGTLVNSTQAYLTASGGTMTGDNTIVQDGFNTTHTGIGKVTFSPTSTRAGFNTGTFAGTPGTLANGDIWHGFTTFLARINGSTNILISAGSPGLTANRVPFGASAGVLSDSANLTFVTNRLLGTTLYLTVSAGTATAGTAPLKMTSGTNLTTAEAGAFEYNGADLFFTKSGTTRGTVLVSTAVTTEAVASDTTLTITHNGTTYKILARA